MDKAFEMGKSSATGSFYLLIGVALSTIIMAVGTLVIASMLHPDQVVPIRHSFNSINND